MVNIDPEKSAQEYRNRVLEPLKETTNQQELNKIEEGLSGACTTEIASFDEFARFITGEGEEEDIDIVIFDTAPTGHTIRLLELNGVAKHTFYLHLKDCEYRFNHRDKNLSHLLLKLLERYPL